MTGLNLHNIAGTALDFINPWKEMVFIKKTVTWEKTSRNPINTYESIIVQGKLQPVNLQQLAEMGFSINEYQYYRVYISADITQLDRIRQLGSDTFTCEGLKYRIVAKEDWIQNGWREAFCYLDMEIEDDGK